MNILEPTDDIPSVQEEEQEPGLIRIRRSSGKYEHVTPEKRDILNEEKRKAKQKALEKRNLLLSIGMFIFAVVLITVINVYINSTNHPVAIEDRKLILSRPDDIIKPDQDKITYPHLFAKQSPSVITATEIIEPSATDPAEETTGATVEDVRADTTEIIDEKAIIADALNRWSDAWSNQRVEEYLLFYHDDFQPVQNMNKQSWVKDRWSKISRPEWIQVIITAMEIDVLGEDRARVIFKQRYEASNYRDAAIKTIQMVKTGTQWKIIREESVRI